MTKKQRSKRSTRATLLRTYLFVAIPVLLALAVATFFGSLWQARQLTELRLAEDALLASRLLNFSAAETSADISRIPELVSSRQLFIIDGNGLIVANTGGFIQAERWDLPQTPNGTNPFAEIDSYHTGNWFSGGLYATASAEQAPLTLVTYTGSPRLIAPALRGAIMPWIGLVILFCLGGALIENIESRRKNQYQQLVEASTLVTHGEFGHSINIDGDSDLTDLGEIFDGMRQVLKQNIDDSALLLRVSQNVAQTQDIETGMTIVLNGMHEASNAVGARAIVFNPGGGRPMQFSAGNSLPELVSLDKRLLYLIKNTLQEVSLRTPHHIRARLDIPEERTIPVQSLIAFPLYAYDRLHGLMWVGYEDEMTHEPAEIELMRSYVAQAATLVANMRLFALAESGRRRLAAVLTSVADAVAVTDQTDHFVLINPAMGAAFDLNIEEIIGRTVQSVVNQPELARILTGRIGDANGRELTLANGKTFFCSVARMRSHDTSILGRVAVFHDITRLKQLEELKSSFVRNVSHDLRNPLAYMHTYASMLPEMGDLNAKQKTYVDNIVNGIERMHNTIGAVLDLNRVESAVDELQLEPINAEPFLLLLSREFAADAESQGNSLVVTPFNDPITIHADRWSLRLAMNNLIGNALKYAPHSGDITLGAQRNGDSTVIFVRDNGIGISKADQMRLFEKYYRASEPATPSVEGSGLGLAIVKSIAQRHGGRVWLDSTLDRGSTFYVSLPTPKTQTEKTLVADELAAG